MRDGGRQGVDKRQGMGINARSSNHCKTAEQDEICEEYKAV